MTTTMTKDHLDRPISPTRHGRTTPLLLLLFPLLLLSSAEAQPGSSSSSPGSYGNNQWNAKFNPSMAIIIVVLISAFFFMGFFSIYIRQCAGDRNDRGGARTAAGGPRSRRSAARGLDPALIETFPTLVYADVKEHKIGKGALECAVCLSEFEDDETLRLLPKCDHVFHPDCIDAWLSSHTTCPVCRSNLVPDSTPAAAAVPNPATDDAAVVEAAPEQGGAEEEQRREEADSSAAAADRPDHVAIAIDEQVAERADRKAEASVDLMARIGSRARLPWRSRSMARPPKFPRSHSTGHSTLVVRPGEDCERFTLRLPDHVRRDILAGKLQRSASCAVYPVAGEGSTRRGYRAGGGGGGEGSSRGGGSIGGRSFKLGKWEWTAKSDRWFARTFSMKVSRGDGAEGSTRRGEGSIRRGAVEGGCAAAALEGSSKGKVFPCLGGAKADAGAVDDEEASTKAFAGV